MVVFIVYWLSSHRFQNILLLASSFLFCGYINIKFLGLLIISGSIAYCSAILMSRFPKHGKAILIPSVLAGLALLGFFKYYNFFVESVDRVFQYMGIPSTLPTLNLMMPLGISFYTFQNISYVVDVYRKNITPCFSAVNYAIYICFFPKFVSGPIERASHLLAQIQKPRVIDLNRFINGLVLLLWGYYQKVVIADNIAIFSDKLFALKDPSFLIVCAGAFAFTLQIFADFSGYTDIARGCSQMLGFDLAKNFNNPYFAKSPSDFWRRWHMSLSSWIRDYIYIPLGGSRVSTIRWVLILFVTFFVIGLWHGASWNFILWGLYYWLLYLLFRLWRYIVPSAVRNIKWAQLVTLPFMFLLTNLGWLIFKLTDFNQLRKYLSILLSGWSMEHGMFAFYIVAYTSLYSLPLILVCSYFFYNEKTNRSLNLFEIRLLRIAAIPILYTAILLLRCNYSSDFIYFNF